jgi:hypothetical protein
MASFPDSLNYTLIYTSTPSSHVKSHRRSAVIIAQDDAANTTRADSGGLFQHYQFFTPAIYMGYLFPGSRANGSLMAMIVLVPVLLIAVTVVSSLKISPFEAPKMSGAKKNQ